MLRMFIRGWTLLNFFCLEDGRLFEVGANSRLGTYLNKYDIIIIVINQSRSDVYQLFLYIYVIKRPTLG